MVWKIFMCGRSEEIHTAASKLQEKIEIPVAFMQRNIIQKDVQRKRNNKKKYSTYVVYCIMWPKFTFRFLKSSHM